MKVALISLDQIWENKERNRLLCEQYIIEAKDQYADLIVFPEMTLTGFSMDAKYLAEIEGNSETIMYFKFLALKYEISIMFGLIIDAVSGFENRLIVCDSKGAIIGNYCKIHPFSYSGEDKVFRGGDQLGICNLMGDFIGLTICYDLRFPELYQALSLNTSIIFNIANWPNKRIDHWESLLKARAIENQVYICGINRTGIDGNGLRYQDSSYAFNPNGEIVTSIWCNDKISIYDLDTTIVQSERDHFPVKKDRKNELYINFLKNAKE